MYLSTFLSNGLNACNRVLKFPEDCHVMYYGVFLFICLFFFF